MTVACAKPTLFVPHLAEEMLWCWSCKQWLPPEDFTKNKSLPHREGRAERCRACVRAYEATPDRRAKVRAYKATPKARASERARKATPENMAKMRASKATPGYKAQQRAYRATPKAKARRRELDATPQAKARQRAYALKSKYGMSVSDYNDLLTKQGGLCAGCGKPPVDGKALFVDHDHTTGRVRGLLHTNCNTALGMAADDPNMVRRWAAYLEAAQEVVDDPS
ncbi:hypothetical protein LCGC14_0878520 [marine sediment metagenome]|uniref:Recombination endonuclease VII n=1 Tax=marine sediment metagenome TaxID=412755 RepID=A0A0F9RM16_9ZZZZ|nr:hypothetical protein [Phycisphaerae bacterium]